jgi:hypothetical protein
VGEYGFEYVVLISCVCMWSHVIYHMTKCLLRYDILSEIAKLIECGSILSSYKCILMSTQYIVFLDKNPLE